MSTRANIFVTEENNTYQIYRHYDGYPENMLEALKDSLELAWSGSRFEADECAAAIVASMKDQEGNIRLMNFKGYDVNSDIDWVYTVKQNDNKDIVVDYYKNYGDKEVKTFILRHG